MCISRILLLISFPLLISKRKSCYQDSVDQVDMETHAQQGFPFQSWLDMGLSVERLLPVAGSLVILLLFACFSLFLGAVFIALALKVYKRLSNLAQADNDGRIGGKATSERAEMMPSDTRREAVDQPRVRFRGTREDEVDFYPTDHQTGSNPHPALRPPVPPPTPAYPFTPVRPSAPVPTDPAPGYPYMPTLPSTPAPAYPSTPVPPPAAAPMTSTPANPFLLQSPASPPVSSPLNPFHEYMNNQSPAQVGATLHPQDRSAALESAFVSMRKEKALDTFTGTQTELKDWLCHFEIISEHNGWSEAEQGSHLASALRGSALQVLDDLPPHEKKDRNCIILALKRRFDPGQIESLRRIEFKNRIKRRNENYTDYGYTLKRLARRAFPQSDLDTLEIWVVDQFIEGLDGEEIKKHVKYKRSKILDEAIASAMEFENVEGRSARRKPEERSVRALAKEKEEKSTLEIAQEIGRAIAKDLGNELSRFSSGRQFFPSPPPRLERGCFECGDPAHFAKNCPQRSQHFDQQQYPARQNNRGNRGRGSYRGRNYNQGQRRNYDDDQHNQRFSPRESNDAAQPDYTLSQPSPGASQQSGN